MTSEVWSVIHSVIEGDAIDRDKGWPDLELELHPMGIARPAEEQTRELHLTIGKAKTVLDEKGIQQLAEFLIFNPALLKVHPDD